MPNTFQNLQLLLADGKTREVIRQLLALTTKSSDQYKEVVQISSQFEEFERKSRLNLADSRLLDTERNRINDALLAIIERLQKSGNSLTRKWNVGKIALWLGIFAAVAAITGYTLRDFFKKPEPVKVEQPIKEEKEPVAPVVQPKETTPAAVDNRGKNNPNITVKDKAKVGAIITGDSNKIDIKQDF